MIDFDPNKNMLRIYIPGGITSNIFSALLPAFIVAKHHITATIRDLNDDNTRERDDNTRERDDNTRERDDNTRVTRIKTLAGYGVEFISYEESTTRSFDIVLWLSTHDDPELLSTFAQRFPTLAISSAAIMDFYLGKEQEEQLNAYKRSKLALARVPRLVTLVPGFYIEDIKTPEWASRGLHGDTTVKLFHSLDKDPAANDGFDWNKSYSVTPKSFMVKVINEWITHPQTFPANQPIIVCSDCVYSRSDLRMFAKQNDLFIEPNTPIYQNFIHANTSDGTPMIITRGMVYNACVVASRL